MMQKIAEMRFKECILVEATPKERNWMWPGGSLTTIPKEGKVVSWAFRGWGL